MKDEYCTICGTLHPVIELNCFNEDTGDRITDNSRCFNADCRIGRRNICGRDFGHDSGRWIKRSFCKRC